MAISRLALLLVVMMMSLGVAESMVNGIMQEEEEVVPADAGGYRKYVVFLGSPSAEELNKFFIKQQGGGGGGGEDDDDLDAAHRAWHQSYLPSTRTSLGEKRLLWSRHTVANYFCARLTTEELKVLSGKPHFISAHPDSIIHRETTHTPAFLGLPNRLGETPED
ncbi:unnamed protein product [Urochloa humidicola]